MTRVAITGLGAVTPLGVGASDAERPLGGGRVGDRGRPRTLPRVRADRPHEPPRSAARGPLHPARGGRGRRGDGRGGLGGGASVRHDPDRLCDRHRDRRDRDDRGAAHDPRRARGGGDVAAVRPADDGQRGRRRRRNPPRPARRVLRDGFSLCRRRAGDRRWNADGRARRRRRLRCRRRRGRA